MIRHHVLITLNDDAVTPDGGEVADQIVAELAAYAPTCETVRDYKVGRDIGLAPGTATVAVVAEFDDVEGYQHYSADPGHVDIIERLIKPNAAGLVRAQTEF
ncbi:MAG: Dabb family protein [Actinomycetota bacterium]